MKYFKKNFSFFLILIVCEVWFNFSNLIRQYAYQIMPLRRGNTQNANAQNTNKVPLVPNYEVTNAEF